MGFVRSAPCANRALRRVKSRVLHAIRLRLFVGLLNTVEAVVGIGGQGFPLTTEDVGSGLHLVGGVACTPLDAQSAGFEHA